MQEDDWALFAEDDVAWHPDFLAAVESGNDPDWGIWEFLSLAQNDGFAYLGVCIPGYGEGLRGVHRGIVTNGRIEMRKACGLCTHAVRRASLFNSLLLPSCVRL